MLLALSCLAPLRAIADEFHDGEEGGSFDSLDTSEDLDFGPSGGGPRGPAATVVEQRPVTVESKIRDAQGNMTAPPNFRIATVVFDDRINGQPTPPPMSTIAPTPAPKLALDEIPTYTGGAPTASTGYFGGDLTLDEPREKETAVPQSTFQNEPRHAVDTANKIRTAMESGTVQAEPFPEIAAGEGTPPSTQEAKEAAKEAIRLRMRVPAALQP